MNGNFSLPICPTLSLFSPFLSCPLSVCLCRRPSQWLAPGVTALTRMVSSNSTPIIRRAPEPQGESEPESEKEVDALEMKDKPRPLRYSRHKAMVLNIKTFTESNLKSPTTVAQFLQNQMVAL